jgi:diguanylate cyclase (GGDEF)-like protein
MTSLLRFLWSRICPDDRILIEAMTSLGFWGNNGQAHMTGEGMRAHDWPSSLAAMWSQWAPRETGDAIEVVRRLTGGLIDIVRVLYRDHPDFDQQCRNYVGRALESGRPAWAAAGRGVWAAGLWRHGDEDSALLQLVLAELELQEDTRSPQAEPTGGPLGVCAASNNLGVAYSTLRMFELAEPHLQRAARLSEELYAPELRLQVIIDYANLAGVGVRWALHAESVGRTHEARNRAQLARRHAREFGVSARRIGRDDAELYARALLIGARSLAAPEELTQEDRVALDVISAGPFFGDEPTEMIVRAIQARVCRLTGDPQGCREAAKRASDLVATGDQTLIAVALREAAMLEQPDEFTWSYARTIAGQTESARRRAVAAFRTRLALAGLEQRHHRVASDEARLHEQLGEAVRGEAELIHAATHDSLTGLPNQMLFHQRLDGALHTVRDGTVGLTVALVDVDDLERVNEEHGKGVGDQILRWVADRLTHTVRSSDTVARIGGDVFAVVMHHNPSVQGAHQWAERVNDDLGDASALTHSPRELPVSVSVGICLVAAGAATSPEQVVRETRNVLEVAKRQRGGIASVLITAG